MTYRVLELTLVSASDLKKVTLFSRMRVYAVASISGGDTRMPTHGTHADRDGGSNPAWNTVFHFIIPAGADTRGLALHVLLRSKRVFGDRDVGEVFVPLDDLLAGGVDGAGEAKTVSYQVRRPLSGRAHGVLYFCYRFTDVKADDVAAATAIETKEGQYVKYGQDAEKAMAAKVAGPPVTAYPPSQAVAGAYSPVMPYGTPYGAYPPQPYGYAAPPPYGYNVAPPPAMYGYPPAAAPPSARPGGGMGMGLGLGLLGGAVGGMMLGDIEADAAYDAGFNDALGF